MKKLLLLTTLTMTVATSYGSENPRIYQDRQKLIAEIYQKYSKNPHHRFSPRVLAQIIDAELEATSMYPNLPAPLILLGTPDVTMRKRIQDTIEQMLAFVTNELSPKTTAKIDELLQEDDYTKKLLNVPLSAKHATLLIEVIQNNLSKYNPPLVNELLTMRANINARDAHGNTALMNAAESNKETLARKLLDVFKASTTAVSYNYQTWDQTAEDIARAKGHAILTNILHNWNSNILSNRAIPDIHMATTRNSNDPDNIISETYKKLTKKGYGYRVNSPLYAAFINNTLKTTGMYPNLPLFIIRESDLNAEDAIEAEIKKIKETFSKQTPQEIQEAMKKDLSYKKWLNVSMPNINAQDKPARINDTVFIQMVKKYGNDTAFIQFLQKQGGDINGRNAHGNTGLMQISSSKIPSDEDAIAQATTFLRYGADIAARSYHYMTWGMTAADIARAYKNQPMLELLENWDPTFTNPRSEILYEHVPVKDLDDIIAGYLGQPATEKTNKQ